MPTKWGTSRTFPKSGSNAPLFEASNPSNKLEKLMQGRPKQVIMLHHLGIKERIKWKMEFETGEAVSGK